MVINTPTAYTLDRGGYNISFMTYDEGGVELKSFIGLHDYIYFGLSFDMQHALGKGEVQPNIPGVVAKIKLTDGFTYFPGIAIGYDSWYESRPSYTDKPDRWRNRIIYGPYLRYVSPVYYAYKRWVKKEHVPKTGYNRMIYGPYLAFTTPIYLFDSEQFISYGVRLPVQPAFEPRDAAYFLAFDIPLGDFFRIRAELERVFWNFRKPDEWVINTGIRFTYFDHLGIEFDILFEPGERIDRILRIEYFGEF